MAKNNEKLALNKKHATLQVEIKMFFKLLAGLLNDLVFTSVTKIFNFLVHVGFQ